MVQMYNSIDVYIETNLISECTLKEVEINSLVTGLPSFSYSKTFYLIKWEYRFEFLEL